jgi:hypothetical protein
MGYLPMNTNRELEAVFNGDVEPDGSRLRPRYFSKLRLEMHLKEVDTYCFRSLAFAPARTGYGGFDKAHKKFAFAGQMGIEEKCQKYPSRSVMLLGVDIDAKHGEQDAQEVCDMLLDLLPGSYFEPSTSGTGIHLYLKVFYDSADSRARRTMIKVIHESCDQLSRALEEMRLARGYQAQVDRVRGYPSLLGYDKTSGRVQVKCRTPCIKIPRFKQGKEDVLWFQGAPYVDLQYLQQLVTNWKRQKDEAGRADAEKGSDALESV